jgi:hypothetical protein
MSSHNAVQVKNQLHESRLEGTQTRNYRVGAGSHWQKKKTSGSDICVLKSLGRYCCITAPHPDKC